LTTEVSVRRSILALPIVLALVVGAPGLAWAGHKFRLAHGAGEAPGGNPTYVMEGKLPLDTPSDLPQEVTDAISEDCPAPNQQPEVQVVYAPEGSNVTYLSSVDENTGADGSFRTTVDLPVGNNPVTYRVRLRCAENLTSDANTNRVSIPGRTGAARFTLFTVTVPLADTGGSSAGLALAGVALLLVGCLLLVYERRLARAG
jgi:hypothetical protein